MRLDSLIVRWVVGALVCGLSLPVVAADAVDPLFASADTLSITITGPIRSISRDKAEMPEYQQGTLTFTDNGEQRVVDIGIRPRGKSRRDRTVCTFPPLRLDLPKKAVADTVFAKQDKLKLVTHCQSGKKGHPYLLREYLAYQVLNLVTDASFKVRLLEIEYVDQDRGGKSMTHPGFFIEHKSRLAKRLDVELVEYDRLRPEQLEPVATSLAELYQFFISNTDFSFIAGPVNDLCCHNAVLLAAPGEQVIPVPYDFDAAGLIDAPYAMPQTALGQRNVRDRIYRGFCRPDPYLSDAVAKFQSVRGNVFALIDGLVELDDRTRQRVVRFVEGFYAVLDDEKQFTREIGGACRPLGS